MLHGQKGQQSTSPYGLRSQSNIQGLVDTDVPAARVRKTISCSFCLPTPDVSKAPRSRARSSTASAAAPSSKPLKGPKRKKTEAPGTSRASPEHEALMNDTIEKKVTDLVVFLTHTYMTKKSTTKEEMLKMVIKEDKDYFPVIFKKACESMEVVFGIEVKNGNPTDGSYVLSKMLDLTYDGMLRDQEGVPKTGLLILILGVIFVEGNCVPEKKVWEVLSRLGMRPGTRDFLYGEPRQLITQDFVKEGYLEYRQVSDSNPTSYEVLWGPRAYVETSKMQVLKCFAKVNGMDVSAFPTWYEEALRDEEERARGRNAATGGTVIMDS